MYKHIPQFASCATRLIITHLTMIYFKHSRKNETSFNYGSSGNKKKQDASKRKKISAYLLNETCCYPDTLPHQAFIDLVNKLLLTST